MATQETVTSRYATVNGLRIHYLDWGNENATPVIMLHGLRSYAHAWDPVAREFTGSYHILALDQRGRGDSDWSAEGEYYTENYVSDLEGIVDQLGLRDFILMGHSMGGANSIVYASKHPDRVKAAIIEDAGARPPGSPPPPGGERIVQELHNTPRRFSSWDEARAFWRSERPLISEEALDIRIENTLKQGPDGNIVWKYDLDGIEKARRNAAARAVDLWPHVRALTCPTLVLKGELTDLLSKEACQAMSSANPNIKWVEVPGASHYVHDDNLDVFNREVRSFLAGV